MSARAGGHRGCGWRRAIVTLPHVVGRQVIEIEVPSDQGAADLLDRIGDLNKARFIPAIARVMNEFERPGVVVAIDRLDLRLGTVPDVRPDTLVERLELALRDALRDALRTGGSWPSNNGHADAARATGAVPVGAALLRSLTRYLLHGIWPYRQDAAGNPMAMLAGLIEHEPAALLQMIHRYRGHPEFIERIALQAAFADLERLLKLIEPEKAATILAAMKTFRDVHRVARVRGISRSRRLWRLILQSVLNGTDAGFDSTGFEQRLLQDIFVTRAAGDSAPRNHAVTEEMPAGIDIPRRIASADARSGAAAADLPMPQDIPAKAEPTQIDLLELFLLQGAWPGGNPDALLIALAAEQPDALARLFRHHARNEAMLRRVTQILSPAALGRLLTLLTPDAAAVIVTHMLEVRGLHRAKPVLPLSDRSLERLLWFVALRFVLNQAGSQFNRLSFVKSLIGGIANAERLTYRELLAALQAGVAEVAKAGPVATSLPAIILELARLLEPADSLDNPMPESFRAAAGGDTAPEALATPSQSRPKEGSAAKDHGSERFAEAAASMASEADRWDPDHVMDRQTAVDIAGRKSERLAAGGDAAPEALATPFQSRPKEGSAASDRGPERFAEAAASMASEPDRWDPETVLQTAASIAGRKSEQAAAGGDTAPEAVATPFQSRPKEGSTARDLSPERFTEAAASMASEPDRWDPDHETVLQTAASIAARKSEQAADRRARAPEAMALPFQSRPKEGTAATDRGQQRFTEAAASMASEPDPWDPDQASGRQTAADIAGRIAEYGHLDRLRHLLMTGVLPWRDILTEPQLTARRLIEALERLRPGLVRTALDGAPLHHGDVRRALEAMPDTAIVNLIRLLLPPNAADSGLTQSIVSYSARAADRKNFQAVLIVALVQGRALDFEALAAASDGPSSQASADFAAAFVADALLAALADGIGGGKATDAQWTETLLRLLASNARAARRFISAVAKSSAALTRMADLCGPALLDRILIVVAPAAGAALTALAQATIAEGARHGMHRRDIVAAFLAELATIDADAGPSAGLFLRILRRSFGSAMPPWLAPMLRRDLLPHLSHEVATTLAAMLAASGRQHGLTEAASVAPPSAKPRGRLPPQTGSREIEKVSQDPASGWQPAEPDGMRDEAATTEVVPGQHAEWLFHALAQSDLSRAAARDEVPELLRELMDELLETSNRELALRLVAFLSQARNSPQLIRLLPERQLARLMMVAAPHTGRSLLDAGEVLAGAVAATGHAVDRATLWQALFDTAVAPVGERTAVALSQRVLAIVGRAANDPDPAQKDATAESLLQALTQHARDAGLAVLAAAVEAQRGVLIAAYVGKRLPASVPIAPRETIPRRAVRARTAFSLEDDEDEISRAPIYIGNAGLVLANPFLPHLFDALGLLARTEAGKPRLRDEAAASHAVHLLQYLVDGRTDTPEPHLALNKVLCGMPIAAPVEREIEATDLERETCDMLLRSIIENWPTLRNTSIAGLRETFLQREGKLTYGEVGWRLQVQRKTLDILVDQVPWSIGVVFHAWMPAALHVTW
ncbi:MAG: hypothetical protein QOJ86_3087 [Bradyrhizobium sp.]|jgi:hypothetical protein|nr:hypothetical protein [Bradyrhizobium sp.]